MRHATELAIAHESVPGPITTPSAFLKAIGRDTETKVNAEEWDDFWQSDGEKFRKMGLGVQDRRYAGLDCDSHSLFVC